MQPNGRGAASYEPRVSSKSVKLARGSKLVAVFELLSGANGRHDEVAGVSFLSITLLVLVAQGERTFRGIRGTGEFGSQSLIGAADFVISLHGHGTSLVDRGSDELEVVGNLPEHFATGGLFDIFVGEAGNFLVAIEHDPQAVTASALLQKGVNPSSTPEGNDGGLRGQQHSIGQVAEGLDGAIHAARAIEHDEVILADEQIGRAHV